MDWRIKVRKLSVYGEKLVRELQLPISHQPYIMLWCEGILPVGKSWICTWWKTNWIRMAITTSCWIKWSHLEACFWLSCKIMTKNILVNSARSTLKVKIKKKNTHVLQMIFWPVQSRNSNTIKLIWDQLEQKVKAKQPTSTVHHRQPFQETRTEVSLVYLFFLAENAENL